MTNIIQEFTIDETSVYPKNWISNQVFLEKLKVSNKTYFLLEYRKYLTEYLAFNPFVEVEYMKKEDNEKYKLNNVNISLLISVSLDKERKWSMGIQPGLSWIKNQDTDEINNKPYVGVSIFLSTALDLYIPGSIKEPYNYAKNKK